MPFSSRLVIKETFSPHRTRVEALKDFVEANPDCTTTAIRVGVPGDNNAIDNGLAQLVQDDVVSVYRRGKGKYHSIR